MEALKPSLERAALREAALACVLLVACGMATACVSPIQSRASGDLSLLRPRRLVVMPFRRASESVSDFGVELVSARVYSALDATGAFDLVSPVDVQIVLERAPASERSELVRAFAGQAFLVGTIRRFEGSQGVDGSARGPAWVDFELALELPDGRRLWSGRYAEQQKGWIEDLTSLSRAYARGFRWVAPGRLASYGADALIGDLIQELAR